MIYSSITLLRAIYRPNRINSKFKSVENLTPSISKTSDKEADMIADNIGIIRYSVITDSINLLIINRNRE